MRVAWIQDNSRPHGGAETSNRCVVAVGEDLGFDVVGVTPGNFHPRVLADCDVAVVNNFFQFDQAQVRTIIAALWEAKKPYVKYEHDNREVGRPEFSKRLFGESILNVFLSPSHLERHRESLGVDGIVLPLAIQTDMFRPVAGVARDDNKALLVGGLGSRGKIGRLGIGYMREHAELTYESVGFDLPGAKLVPSRPMSEMPALYSSAGWLVHLPDRYWAGERIVFEAALCGCRVVMNDKVGHKSWGRDLSDADGLRAWLRQAPYDFWKAVDTAVRKGRATC